MVRQLKCEFKLGIIATVVCILVLMRQDNDNGEGYACRKRYNLVFNARSWLPSYVGQCWRFSSLVPGTACSDLTMHSARQSIIIPESDIPTEFLIQE